MTRELKFRNPSFSERIKGMLGVDFYRLFHTPMFYIFLCVAAIIPAMVSAMTMMPDQNGNTMEPLYSNVWQIIAATKSLYVIETIADYANMNMVFIFGGMCITYFIGGTVGGLLVGYETTVNVGSLIIAILGKIIMSLGWASLYTFLNVIFRRYFGISVASSFFFGTGILIIGAAAIVENLKLPTAFLNIFLYGASVNANLSSGIGSLVICIVVSVAWAVIYNVAGTRLLNKCDVY